MKKLIVLGVCLLTLLVAKAGYCWDGVGHMLIDQIAYNQLTAAAKEQVQELASALNSDPLTQQLPADLQMYQPVTVGTWPDDIRSLGDETHSFSAWHFIDLDALSPLQFTPDTPGRPGMPIADSTEIAAVKAFNVPGSSDVYLQIIAESVILKDKAQPIADRARALAFVMHFVGDIHQPLHCIGRQRGGNQYVIDELPSADPDWSIKNLHSFWDNAYRYQIVNDGIVVNPLLQVPRPTAPDTGDLKTWADTIESNYLPHNKIIIDQTDPAAWAVESNELATSFAFPADNTPALSNDYIQKASDIARERLALAGYRLGHLLNDLLN